MEQEIKDIITKQLPAQVGEVLRVRLEQAEKDAAKLTQLDALLTEERTKLEAANKRIAETGAELAAHVKLAEREAACSKRENGLELELAKTRVINAEKGRDDLFNLMGVVFRNPVVKEIVCRSDSGYTPTGSTNGSSAITTTRETD